MIEGVYIMNGNNDQGRPNWSQYGVAESIQKKHNDNENYKEEGTKEDELFNSDSANQNKPWWKANFMLTDTVQFGTWDGVFTSCMLNIFGVVIFLRTGWMVGIAGLGYSVLIIMLTMMIALIAVLGAIGVCERCQIEAGGVYFLLSHVLGSRVAASIGFLYCFGQAVASSLYIAGFGESICSLLGYTNPWIAKGIGIGVIVLLLGINLAGVKWVIRLQLVLLLILFISVLDFLVGSFIKQTPEYGVIGYNFATFQNNTLPQFTNNHNFFSVFGIFFPTATGVCAGINMSGDLHNPKRSIPIGTLAAIGVSLLLYLCFALVLAGKCARYSLQTDNMIASKVAFLGPLLLFGLYVSSLSSALGGISTAPKLLRAISETTQLPGTSVLAKCWGRNKVPVISILCVVTVTLSFVLIGDIDILGPIVTMPFLLTYATLSYSYFVLAKSFDIRRRREELFEGIPDGRKNTNVRKCGDNVDKGLAGFDNETEILLTSVNQESELGSDSFTQQNDRKMLEQLFPERQTNYGSTKEKSNKAVKVRPNKCNSFVLNDQLRKRKFPEHSINSAPSKDDKKESFNEIVKQPRSFYSRISNRWVSLLGTGMFLALMFAVNWIYALTCIGIWCLLYIYVGHLAPGLFPGVAEFSLLLWMFKLPNSIRNSKLSGESKLLIPPQTPDIRTQQACVTEESKDYVSREKYHQSKIITDDTIMQALAGKDPDGEAP